MTDKELIEEYISLVYRFTSTLDVWIVKDKTNGNYFSFNRLTSIMERKYPNMDSTKFCTLWWDGNIQAITDKINGYLKSYKLVLGNKMLTAWDVVNNHGKELNFDDLIDLVPSHHEEEVIKRLYEEWFEEQRYIATSKEMGIK